jgi:hypothetical protein
MRTGRTTYLGFRFDAESAEEIGAEAEALGLGRSQYLRLLVERGRSEAGWMALREEVSELRRRQEETQQEQRRLRSDLATVTTTLLVNAGKVSAEEAISWVKKKLLRP